MVAILNIIYILSFLFGIIGTGYAFAAVIHIKERKKLYMVFWFLLPADMYDEYGRKYRLVSLVFYIFSSVLYGSHHLL